MARLEEEPNKLQEKRPLASFSLLMKQQPSIHKLVDPWTGVGTRQEETEGHEYLGKFRGKAYLASDFDVGSFLSERTSDNYREEWAKLYRAGHENPGYLLDRTMLGMSGLFPEGWEDSQIEYEITVRARRIPAKNDEENLDALKHESEIS